MTIKLAKPMICYPEEPSRWLQETGCWLRWTFGLIQQNFFYYTYGIYTYNMGVWIKVTMLKCNMTCPSDTSKGQVALLAEFYRHFAFPSLSTLLKYLIKHK